MTMHLLGKGYTTTRYKQKKQKMSKSKQKQYDAEWREHNRWCKQRHMPTVSYLEFVEIKTGKKRIEPEFKELAKPAPYQRDTKAYPSKGDGIGVATAKESPVYSGERKLLGIATLHKSNMVPVFDAEYAKDVARMRR